MKILGIDPGLQITGWGVIECDARPTIIEAGIIRTNPKDTLADRLADINESVRCIIETHKPDAVSVEDLYSHYAHPTTAILMGHARGVIILAAACAKIPVTTFSATRIKKCTTGNGHASKSQMQSMITTALGLKSIPEPPDVCDALAAAVTYFEDTKRRMR